MNNLKKPIFWAFVSMFGYVLAMLVTRIITQLVPNGQVTTTYVMLAIICVVFAVFVVFFMRRPIEGTPFESVEWLIGGCFVIMGIFYMFLGGTGLLNWLALPLTVKDNLSLFGMNLVTILMLPFGFLMFIFSIPSFVSSIMKKKDTKSRIG